MQLDSQQSLAFVTTCLEEILPAVVNVSPFPVSMVLAKQVEDLRISGADISSVKVTC